MNDQTNVQALWTMLAPLTRQATEIRKQWRKYSRQADSLNELQQRATSACARSAYPQEDGELHWAIVRRLGDLRAEHTAICRSAAIALRDLEDTLPLASIEALEKEIDPRSVYRTCQGIITAAQELSEHCGPAPAGWPGDPDGDAGALLDDSMIAQIEAQVEEMEQQQKEIDETERKHFEAKQAEARRNAEAEQRQREIQTKTLAEAEHAEERHDAEQQDALPVQAQAAAEEATLLEKARRMKAARKKPREIKQVIMPLLRAQNQALLRSLKPEDREETIERLWGNICRGLYKKK